MNWLAAIVGLIKLAGMLADYLRERDMLTEAQHQKYLEELAWTKERSGKAHEARKNRRAVNDAAPGGVPNDGFRRD